MTRPIRSALARRSLIAAALAILAIASPAAAQSVNDMRRMTVIETPLCGCCTTWAERMREAGFVVTVEEREDLAPVRHAAGVPDAVRGCHTATVAGYVLEGHVPAAAVERLLAERPAITGLSVPGMPEGSPGMGDDPAARFDVLTFDAAGAGPVWFEAGL